jgi:hypothetical protein
MPDAESPALQASTLSQTSAQAAGPVPAAPETRRDAPPLVATDKANEPFEASTGGGTDAVAPKTYAWASGDAEGTTRGGDDARVMGSLRATPMKLFLILVLVLVVAATLSRYVIKIAAARRKRVIVDRSESDWAGDQRQHRWRDNQGQYGSVEELLKDYSFLSAATGSSRRHPLRTDDEVQNTARGDGDNLQIKNERKYQDTLAQFIEDLDRMLRSPRPA